LNLYERGDVLLDAMVAETYPLDDVARAFDHMLAGTGAKRVLVLE
jgi:Zn-dependent alcohol dehydrogenase